MAIVTVPAESRRITDATEIRDFLAERGLARPPASAAGDHSRRCVYHPDQSARRDGS